MSVHFKLLVKTAAGRWETCRLFNPVDAESAYWFIANTVVAPSLPPADITALVTALIDAGTVDCTTASGQDGRLELIK